MPKSSILRLVDFWFLQSVGRTTGKIDEKKLTIWKLLDDFRCRLGIVQFAAPSRDKRAGDPKRLLLDKDQFSPMRFGHFNLLVDSTRGLGAASHLKRVLEDIYTRSSSLGSFSEALRVFDPELLKQVFLELAGEIPTSWGDARLDHLADKLVDGTLLLALPRMHWALWEKD